MSTNSFANIQTVQRTAGHHHHHHPQSLQTPPEWLRLPEATRLSGICRSSLYVLFTSGEVHSVCLRRPGAKRGIRLISHASLMAYIERQAAGTDAIHQQEGGSK